MRDMLISVIAAASLIICWQIFFTYSENNTTSMASLIESEIIPAAEAGNWSESQADLSKLHTHWQNYKEIALIFLDTESITEIDYTLARATKYLQVQDISNSSGELLLLYSQLLFLNEKEKINPANIL